MHATACRSAGGGRARRDPCRICPPYVDYDAYVKDGGYKLLNDLRAGALSKEDLLKALDDSSLRGLGGAGFPTGRKWRAVLGEPGPRLMAVNGDEGEPGTFKDRFYLLRDPHRFLEGMLIGAHIVDATDVYIYIRDEYPAALKSRRWSSPSCRRAVPTCTCAAAPAPISAARNPRCWKASKASAACRGTSRHIRSRSGCSACRR